MQLETKGKLVSEKYTLKQRLIKDKEGYYVMIKGLIQEEDITFVNIYAPNIGAPNIQSNN